MALKRALVTGTSGTGGAVPFDYDIQASSAGFASDIKLAIFSGNNSDNPNETTSDICENITYGYAANVSGTTKKSNSSLWSDNNVTTSNVTNSHDWDTFAYYLSSNNLNFNVTNWAQAADTIRITHSNFTVATGRYMSTLLLGGDIEANVVQGNFSSAGNGAYIDISHGLGGAPEIILCFTNQPTSIPDLDTGQQSAGFWAGGSQACTSTRLTDGSTSGQVGGGRVSATYIAMDINSANGDMNFGFAISNVGPSTFRVTVTTSGSSNHDLVFLCIRGTSTAITATAGIYTTPTATGTHSIGASLGVKPSVLMLLPTRMTALDTSYNTDAATLIGMMMSVDRSGTSATQSGGAVTTYDIAATTRCRGRVRNDAALEMLTDVGADEARATVNEWQAADVQLNYSDAPSSAYKIPYLMFGMAEGPSITSVDSDLYGNTRITVTGTGFGASQGNGDVWLSPTNSFADPNKVVQSVVSWSDTSIVFTAVRGTLNYDITLYLFVEENGGTYNSSGSAVTLRAGIKLVRTV